MIAQLVEKEVVGGLMREVLHASREELATPPTRRRLRPRQRPEVTDEELEDALKELDRCRGRLMRSTDADETLYIPRDAVASLFQSAVEEYIRAHHGDAVRVARAPGRRRRPGESPRAALLGEEMVGVERLEQPRRGGRARRKFEVRRPLWLSDPLWISSKVAEGIRLFRGKHPFNHAPAGPVTLHDEARLLLVSDWGTGIERARAVAARMEDELARGARERREQHVIHLGDVYYSGWGWECERRFLRHWPVGKMEREISSWALNGNHEMYSGGYGYFGTLLADQRFARQEQSSVFSMENRYWRILGLDTAWEDKSLHGDQGGWVAGRVAAEPKLKSLLLSHHQLFSAYEKGMPKIVKQLERVLSNGGVEAWFWGHEHRCVLYGEHAGVRAGRCIGHGGVPEYMLHDQDDPYPAPAAYEYRKRKPSGGEPWNTFGFAVLDFHGTEIHVRYIDEDGEIHFKEQLS